MPKFELAFKMFSYQNWKGHSGVEDNGLIENNRIIIAENEVFAGNVGRAMEGEEYAIVHTPHGVLKKTHCYLGQFLWAKPSPLVVRIPSHDIGYTWRRVLDKMNLSEKDVEFYIENGLRAGFRMVPAKKQEDSKSEHVVSPLNEPRLVGLRDMV